MWFLAARTKIGYLAPLERALLGRPQSTSSWNTGIISKLWEPFQLFPQYQFMCETSAQFILQLNNYRFVLVHPKRLTNTVCTRVKMKVCSEGDDRSSSQIPRTQKTPVILSSGLKILKTSLLSLEQLSSMAYLAKGMVSHGEWQEGNETIHVSFYFPFLQACSILKTHKHTPEILKMLNTQLTKNSWEQHSKTPQRGGRAQ